VNPVTHLLYDRFNPTHLTKFLGSLIQVDIEAQLEIIQNHAVILWGGKDTFLSKK